MPEDLLTGDPASLFHRLQERYALGQDPLAMESPFFQGAQRQYALETLRHLTAFGDMALLLTGGRGSGKTRLLAELVKAESERLKFHRFSVAEIATEQSLADALLRIAHHGLGAGRSSRDAIFGFFKWSETATRKGQRIVLLLDDADHMPPAVTRVLLAAHRAADCSQCAVPVLTGADTLIASLGIGEAGDDTQQRVHQIHIRPLNRDELAEYLVTRIRQAGGDPAVLLNNARLKRLHELSQGSFSRLKRIAPAVWLDLTGHQPQITGQTKTGFRKIMWPALAVLLLGLSWIVVSWQYDTMVASDQEVAPRIEPERQTVRLGPDAEIWADTPTAEEPVAEQTDQDSGAPDEDESTLGAASGAQDEPPLAEGPELFPGMLEQSETPSAAEGSSEKIDVTAEDEPAESSSGGLETAGNVVASSGSDLVDDNKDEVAEQVPESSAAESPAEIAPAEPEEPDEPEEKVAFEVGNPERFRPVEELRQREGYTAQYVAGYEESTALKFLQRYPDIEGLIYTRSTHKGKPWYLVIYGGFASRGEADQAIQQLPQKLAQQDVWIRSFSGL